MTLFSPKKPLMNLLLASPRSGVGVLPREVVPDRLAGLDATDAVAGTAVLPLAIGLWPLASAFAFASPGASPRAVSCAVDAFAIAAETCWVPLADETLAGRDEALTDFARGGEVLRAELAIELGRESEAGGGLDTC